MYDVFRYLIYACRCIDGYSRKIIWLRCGSSNHDPAVIAGYFVDAIRLAGGCPQKVRSDCGTENVNVAALQIFLTGRTGTHVYGSSPANQRIEAWWSFFRRNRAQWWIDLFEDLTDAGQFHVGHLRETDCLRFCYMSILRKDLNEVVRQWNTHRIRPSRGSLCPAGIPDILYLRPRQPAVDCLVHCRGNTVVPVQLLDQVKSSSICVDGDFL